MKQKIFNILFWTVSILIFYNLYAQNYEAGFLDVAYTFLLHIPLAYAFYSGSILANRHLINTKYVEFTLAALLNILISIGLHYVTYSYLADLLFPHHYLVTFFTLFEIVAFNSLYFLFGTLITMTFNWFALKDRQIDIEREKNDIQMKTLKSQINPHFLFNSLNNIYSSIPKSEKGSREYLLRLSESLRYMIYETDGERVPLIEEINYLKNYIELEKLRLEEPNIDFQIIGSIDGLLIAPLILIPLVENCFKHLDKDHPSVSIVLTVDDYRLNINTVNSFDSKVESGGRGIGNMVSRLTHLYPKRFQYDNKYENDLYHASLTINLEI